MPVRLAGVRRPRVAPHVPTSRRHGGREARVGPAPFLLDHTARVPARRTRAQVGPRSFRHMSYSQPDPAEETTHSEEPEQPDTDQENLEEQGGEHASLEIDADDVPTSVDPQS